ncbi:hypothetical protein HON52_02800 [Candidatus Uhrbacteria bacterium]|jgi:predicted protein tyrosine phosphatase|nr:hypothetical protein [Candidatus Uhrbacteria bacterium]
MKVLLLCEFGQNRSRHLAEYLSEKGYDTNIGGTVADTPSELQRKIDWADTVVTVHPVVRDAIKPLYLEGKRVIELDVDDKPKIPLEGQAWREYQEKSVYSKLRTLIDFELK